jgi:hypothetical protein
MTVFDRETDRYLERVAAPQPGSDWDDVLRRAHRARRRSRRTRVAVAACAAVAATGIALVTVVPVDELGGRTILDKAQAAVLAPVRAAPGTIERTLIQYRTDSGHVFNEYETLIASDGAWCSRTVEGLPDGSAPDTRLTECRTDDGVMELYLPARDEILRTRPGAEPDRTKRGDLTVPLPSEVGKPPAKAFVSPDGTVALVNPNGDKLIVKKLEDLPARERKAIEAAARKAKPVAGERVDPGPAPDWLTEDVIDSFRRDAVHEAGTATLDGRTYTKLVTDDGLNAILVDPETGEGVAWIPSPKAFGVPTTVVRTNETLPDDAATRRELSPSDLHPDATIREVSPAEYSETKASQYPRG